MNVRLTEYKHGTTRKIAKSEARLRLKTLAGIQGNLTKRNQVTVAGSIALFVLHIAPLSTTQYCVQPLMLSLRPAFRSTVALHRPITQNLPRHCHARRTMASGAAPLQEWLVILPDFAGALDKRLSVRPKHLEGLKQDRDDMWLWGGA
jgi:hypothetical protein